MRVSAMQTYIGHICVRAHTLPLPCPWMTPPAQNPFNSELETCKLLTIHHFGELKLLVQKGT